MILQRCCQCIVFFNSPLTPTLTQPNSITKESFQPFQANHRDLNLALVQSHRAVGVLANTVGYKDNTWQLKAMQIHHERNIDSPLHGLEPTSEQPPNKLNMRR